MSVFVDELVKWGRSPRWRFGSACHMFADTIAELHGMADLIGLKRCWFQRAARLPHYDLTANKRCLAIRHGAIEVDRRFVSERIKRNRRAIKQLDDSASSPVPSSLVPDPRAARSLFPAPCDAAGALRAVGLHEAASHAFELAAPGSIAYLPEARTMAEAFARIDDATRKIILDASKNDRVARDQAVASIDLWWDQLPRGTRNHIDFRVQAWIADRRRGGKSVPQLAADQRRLDLLLNELRQERSGAQCLGVACRL